MSDYIYTNGRLYNLDELQHHGVKGQKWGVRRYQNPDGSLTEAGKKRVHKTLRKYAKSKDRRAMLGDAVGKDAAITEAARKLLPARMKYEDAISRTSKVFAKMEKDEGGSNISDRIWKKYEKEYNKTLSQEENARVEYEKATKDIVNAYLGKYGDMRVNKSATTAGQALVMQMEWGIGLGRLNKKKD